MYSIYNVQRFETQSIGSFQISCVVIIIIIIIIVIINVGGTFLCDLVKCVSPVHVPRVQTVR